MPSDLRSLVTKEEVKGWLKPKNIAELAANFEESLYSGSQVVVQWSWQGATSRGLNYRAQAKQSAGASLNPNSGVCLRCPRQGHFQRNRELSRGTAANKAVVLCVAPQNLRSFESRATSLRHTVVMKHSILRDRCLDIFM